jgi:hypothetical protein
LVASRSPEEVVEADGVASVMLAGSLKALHPERSAAEHA